MNVDARINLNMSQRLVMTPMLQQAIKLLQMSRLELVDMVKQEMLDNPVLDELEEGRTQESLASLEENGRADEASGPDLSDSLDAGSQNTHGELSVNWEDYFNDNPSGLGYYGEYDPDDGNQSFDNLLSRPQSLAEHLSWQLQMSMVPERSRKIGDFLIGQIGDDAYIRIELEEPFTSLNIHDPNIEFSQLEEYREWVVKQLCQKVSFEFEREYILAHVELEGTQRILANVLLQEYYDELNSGDYASTITKLQCFTLEDFDTISKLLCATPPEEFEKLTGIPASEIHQGITAIVSVCQSLPDLIVRFSKVLLNDNYVTKLEKLGLPPEELFLVEYLLSLLSVGELSYVACKEDAEKSEKHEEDIQTFLEQLRQSYAHIETLHSHKYFLIQLYTVGLNLISNRFSENSPFRYQKLFLKLLHPSEQDVEHIAQSCMVLGTRYYQQEKRVMVQEVAQLLRHIQSFTPAGVAARDLKECLLLQARSLDIRDSALESVINLYLNELRQGRYKTIEEKLGIDRSDVELIQKIIGGMSLRPGADFVMERPEYIVPDIYVYKVDGEYEVVLNEDDLPSLRINPTYKKIISGHDRDVSSETRQYVDQKLRSAMWFIRSVEQRKRTIYKVGKSLVKFQQEFLEYGLSHLKPLVLRDVADDIAMHESTVSRVTTNKYIHTPQGVFELKFFFHSGLGSSSGSDVSSIALKERIKRMIDEENCEQPLSDKAIEDRLKQAGISIARRTIAKYREDLNIPSSIQRKRKKNG
ncbi:RNA polymerase sigma-54 factor [candidate division KSB3 bacterium]|uniref:RNA polymerase sigma-54 factor n=1 Tax=candidate division KSB3 bacterium TaxID=2044937 RepID=A0A2G6E7F4_9BACT|nr:MAG: RNA polymerase sigma-54 factor [candidate division KSB3 bacterium]PIE30387.1 MAG: RNA polymerase sigma-54 factor [candidate division KSB3 bacterium]